MAGGTIRGALPELRVSEYRPDAHVDPFELHVDVKPVLLPAALHDGPASEVVLYRSDVRKFTTPTSYGLGAWPDLGHVGCFRAAIEPRDRVSQGVNGERLWTIPDTHARSDPQPDDGFISRHGTQYANQSE